MKEKFIHISVIAVPVSLFYLNSFDNFFVWNDWTLIIENSLVASWRNLPEIFSSAFWKPLIGEPSQIYRPLVLLSFVADYALWGLEPWGYHLTNLALHVFNSVLVYFLFRIYVSSVSALIATLLFAVHPIHTEAVTYISGRGDLLTALFFLSGLLLFLQSETYRSWRLYLASLPFVLLAMLAKETAAVLILLFFVADVTAFPSPWRIDLRRPLGRLAGPLLTLGGFYLLRKFFIGMTIPAYSPTAPDFIGHLLLSLKSVPFYLGLLLFPWNLYFLHPVGAPSSLDVRLALSMLLLAGVGWGLRYAARQGNHAVAFALLWFLVGMLPLPYLTASRLSPLEGWSYLPSLGFFLLASVCLDRLQSWSPPRAHLWFALLIAALLGGITVKRNQDWKDEMRISLHTSSAAPDDPAALRLLGNAHFKRGRTPEAEKIFQKALLLTREDARLYESVGLLYSFMGRDSEALDYYQRMRALTPRDPYPYWRIARFYLFRKNYDEAAAYFAQATRLFPYSSELHNNLARAYYLQGKLDAAEAELRAALKISPLSAVLQENLEQVLKRKG